MADIEDTMKQKLLYTVDKLREEGVDIAATPPLFQWTYPEEPNILFELLISDISKDNISSKLH